MTYGNIADWRTYASDRGNSAPTSASDADANAALLRASDYIRTRYVLRIGGLDGTEANVIEATYIAAGYELTAPGFWAKTFTPSQAKVLTKVDQISWTPVEQKGMIGADAMLPTSPAIDALLTATGGWNVPVHFVV